MSEGEPSRRLALVLSYDGAGFAGWQRQDEQRTVQQAVEDALGVVLRAPAPTLHASGRTDAGVHALGQVAHADVSHVPDAARARLNGVLPRDVRVMAAVAMPATFHARSSASWKRYRYSFHVAPVAPPLVAPHALHVRERLDLAAMAEAARALVGRRDFASLRSAGSAVTTSVREVLRCEIEGRAPAISLVVEGKGFLRHMVRAMAGSLLMVGRGARDAAWMTTMLAEAERGAAGPNASAHALVLEHVEYPAPFADLLRAAAGRDGG